MIAGYISALALSSISLMFKQENACTASFLMWRAARGEFHSCFMKNRFYLQLTENLRIEPMWYCPVIPTVLVNGCEGVGTGFSTTVPSYNPREIVANIGD